jgi:hypothetical protein
VKEGGECPAAPIGVAKRLAEREARKEEITMRVPLRFILWVIVLVVVTSLPGKDVEAFCVYNHADFDIEAVQVEGHKAGRGFSKKIYTKDNACCHWDNRDCNNRDKRKREDPVAIRITGFCERVSIKAGGWIKFWADRPGDYRCETGF